MKAVLLAMTDEKEREAIGQIGMMCGNHNEEIIYGTCIYTVKYSAYIIC